MKRILKFIGCLALGCVGLTTLADTVAKIEGKGEYETLAAAFEAVKSGDTLEIVKAGEYPVSALPGDGYTLKATVDGVMFTRSAGAGYLTWDRPAGIILSNITWTVGTANYQYWGNVKSFDCTFIGDLCCGQGSYFERCTLKQSDSDYTAWAYGACSFKDCTFTNSKTGKFVNVYNEGSTVYPVSFVGCKFINTADKANKAALNVKATCGSVGLGSVVTVEDCSVEGPFPSASTSASLIVFNGVVQLDDIKANVPCTVSITQDGRVIYNDNAPIPEPITVTVVKNEEKGVTQDVVTEIAGNKEVGKLEETGLKEALPAEELAKGEPVIKVQLQEVAANTLKFDVSPYVGEEKVDSNTLNGKPVAVRLPLVAAEFNGEYAKIVHGTDPIQFVLVKKGTTGAYVDLTLTHFSEVEAILAKADELVHAVDPSAVQIQPGLWGANGVTEMGHAEIVYSVGKTGLKAFRDWVNAGNSGEGQTFKLVADVDLGNENWTPIATSKSLSFKGTFDGVGHTISSLKIEGDPAVDMDIGLFGYITTGASLKNFTVDGSVVVKFFDGSKGNGGGAGVVGYMTGGTVDSVTNRASVSSAGTYGRLGGICGIAKSAEARIYIKNCANYGNIVHEFNVVVQGGYCGGIVSQSQSLLSLVDCVNYGSIKGGRYNDGSKVVIGLGGIIANIGKDDDTAHWPVEMVRCVNYGIVGGDTYAQDIGGLIGKKHEHTERLGIEGLHLTDCANYGVVSSAIDSLGEIGGAMCSGTRCVWNVTGTLTARKGKVLAHNNAVTRFKGIVTTCPGVAKDINGNDIDVDIYYTSIAGAIAAAKAGDTVKLVASSTEAITLPVDIKLDASASGVTYDPAKITVPEGYVLKGQDTKVYYVALAPLEKGADGKYHIKSLNDLKSFRNMVNVDGNTFAGETVVLDANIDLNNENWEPIGTEANAVHGIYFDGQNHKISNLKIAGTDLTKQGLFGVISLTQDEINHGPIPYFVNLTIENVDIDIAVTAENKSEGVGPLFGSLVQNGTVSNVTVTGSVKVKGSKYVGGLAGYGLTQFYDCKVIDTTDDGGIIAGSKGVGGIEGFGADRSVRGGGVFDSEVANFKIYGDVRVGGLMGQANGGNFRFERNTVSNVTFGENAELSYATYNPAIFGTLLGCDHAVAIPSSVLDCTVGENVVAPEGVTKVGKDANGAPLADNLKTIIGTNAQIDYLDGHSLKISGGTFEQLPTGWLAEGSLMDVDQVTGIITVVSALKPGEDGVYHIATMQDLTVFRLMVNGGNNFGGKTVVLDADIDFAGEWNSGIGDGDHKFMGMFDGQGYKITGLKISAADKDTIGLFGFVDESGVEVWNSWVKNLVLDGAQIVGKENVGGIVGYVHRGIIENCTITNSTISGTVKVGSVAGMMYPGRCIGNTIVATTVSGTSHIGGVAGQMVGGSVSGNVLGGDDAASKVTVTATAKKDECGAGGLVGAVSCSDGGKNYVNDNTIKCAEAITDGVTAPIPFCDFRKNLFSKDESKVEIKRNTWPTVDPNADYYDMVDFASTSEPKDYLRVYNFHPVAEIAGKGPEYRYEKMWDAVLAAVALPSTKEAPVVVQLYPGVVQTGDITGGNITFAHVVIQGASDGTSTLKDCEIQFQANANLVEDLTFKNIVWDNSRITFSTNSKLKDIAFIGNTFKNLGPCASGEARGAVHMNLNGGTCMNFVYEGNVFDTSVGGSFAAINTKNVSGNITIRNNVFKNSCWRSVQLMFNSNDGIDDNVTLSDNWFVGNKYWIQIHAQNAAGGDAVGINVNYNVFDENAANHASIQIASFNAAKTSLALDHNYYTLSPDAAPDAFDVGGDCTAGNIYDAGVYPYYNAYHKDELAAGTKTVRESLYNLVDPAAIVVNEDGKFVKMTIADAMAAAQAGESVMLIRDAADEDVVITGEVTFDTNGKAHGEIKAAEGYLLVDLGGGKYIAKSPVAEIVDGQKYDTLEKAIAAVTENQTIKMLANVALTKVLDIPADKSFTLDLNGKKISDAETGFDWSVSNVPTGTPANLMIVLRGTMKVCDTSANQDGSIWTDDFGYAKTKAVLVADNGNLTLESGTIYGEYAGCYVVGYTGNDPAHTPIVPTLTLNGGVISGGKLGVGVKGMTAKLTLNDGAAIKSKAWYGISTNGTTDWYDGGNCQITVNGGLVECEEGPAIYNPAESIIQIKGGVVKGLSGIAVKGGNVTISGDASVIATGVKVAPVYVKSGVEVTGDAIYIEDSYENHKPVVSVIGGMLKSANGHAVQYWTNKAADKIGSLSIAGGSLIAAKDEAAVLVGGSAGPVKFIKAQVDEGGAETGYPLFNSRIIPQYIAEGYIEKDNGNGTWTVTKGQAEIEVVIKPVEPTVDMAEGMTEAEKTEGKKQADQIKENIVVALSDPSISDIVGTGVIDATYKAPGELWGYVVDALRAEAPSEEIKGLINSDTDVKSHVEITFESLEVKVAIDESEQRVVKSTLNKVKYEIKPILTTYITVGNVTTKVQARIPSGQELANPIEFALSLEPSFVSEMAKVTHLKADDTTVIDTKTYPVKRDGEKAYIQLAWKQFSFADIEGQSVEQQVCTVNGDMYDSVATAAATADDGAVITLLKDIPSDAAPVQLKPLQVIELNGKSFDAPLTGVAEGYELAKTPEGQAFIAPEKIEVPTTGEPGAPTIKVRIAGKTAEELMAIHPTSKRPLWADLVMGTNEKLIPMVPRSPIGIGTVTIRTTLPDSTFVRTAATARDGVSVKYQLKKRVGNGDFLEYGEVKDIPVFTVDAAALETRTSWKIETIFDEEY